MSTNIQKFLDAGLSVIPIKDKIPSVAWKEFQTRQARMGELSFNGSLGLVCGFSGVEAVDIDSKNDPTLLDRLEKTFNDFDVPRYWVVQKTPSGGLHLVYKCEKIEGNQILAKSNNQKVLIETRGIGGYIAIDPTPGYELRAGTFEDIPTITIEERDTLLSACRSLNEYFEPIVPPKYTQTTTGTPPWDDYNNHADVPALLQTHGWTYLRTVGENQHFCRPDKNPKGTSGTWSEGKRLFHCFTSSTMFEPSKAYSPTAVFAYLECKKDFSEANKRLMADGFGEKSKDTTSTVAEQKEQLPSREKLRMTFKYIKKNTQPALLVNNKTLIHYGHVYTIVGLPGDGKTSQVEALACTALGKPMFGYSFNSNGKKVLVIDTERTPDDVYDSYKNIHKRIKAETDLENLVHLTLSAHGKIEELKSILEREMATEEFDLVILDGILDFSGGMNDDKDATELVKWVRALSVKHNTATVLTIHPNKGSETIAGHLGSMLYRWSRAILYVRSVKGNKSIKELTGEPGMAKLSHADLGEFEPVYFSWNHHEAMMMQCDFTPTSDRGAISKANKVLQNVLADGTRLRYSELLKKVVDMGHAEGTAKRWIKNAAEKEMLNTTGGVYSINQKYNEN